MSVEKSGQFVKITVILKKRRRYVDTIRTDLEQLKLNVLLPLYLAFFVLGRFSTGIGGGASGGATVGPSAEQQTRMTKFVKRLVWYPAVLIVSWTFATINRIQNAADPDNQIFTLFLLHVSTGVMSDVDASRCRRYSSIVFGQKQQCALEDVDANDAMIPTSRESVRRANTEQHPQKLQNSCTDRCGEVLAATDLLISVNQTRQTLPDETIVSSRSGRRQFSKKQLHMHTHLKLSVVPFVADESIGFPGLSERDSVWLNRHGERGCVA